MSLVLLSEKIALIVAGLMVTWKSVAFKLASEFRLMEPLLLVPFVPLLLKPLFRPLLLLLLLFVVFVTFGWNCMVALVGGLMPRVRLLSLVICITATSTTTSGFDRARSSTNFAARAIWSGLPRTTIAPSEGSGWIRAISRICRSAFTTS